MKNIGFVSRMLMHPMVLNALSLVKIVYLGNRWGWVQQRIKAPRFKGIKRRTP